MTSFSLSTIARAHVFAGLASLITSIRPLPSNIGNYSLVSTMTKDGTFHEFLIGLYSNGAKLAVGKTWSGSHPLFYHSLKNEAHVYKMLCKKAQELSFRTPRAIKHIHIPQILGYQETSKSLSLLIEYISGTSLHEHSADIQKKEYLKAIHYLRYLGENMSSYEKNKIGKRTAMSEIVSYPVLLLFALIANLGEYKTLLRSCLIFIKYGKTLMLQKKLVLTHRDLHFKNIILAKNEMFIIDLEYTVFALPEIDLVNSVISQWKNVQLRKYLLGELSSYNHFVVNALLIKMSTHYLINRKLSEEHKKRYLDILQTVNKGLAIK